MIYCITQGSSSYRTHRYVFAALYSTSTGRTGQNIFWCDFDPLYNHHAFGAERFQPFVQKKLDLEDFAQKLGASRGWNEFGFKASGDNRQDNPQGREYEKDPLCEKCKNAPANPDKHDLVLYLHSYKYSGPDWAFQVIPLNRPVGPCIS